MSSCVNGVLPPFGRRTVAFGSIVAFFGSKVVKNDSTWLYPRAQKIFVAIATAAVAPSGKGGGSNSRNQVSPFASLAVKPGCAPEVFSLISTHFDGLGGAPIIGPRTSSSVVMARVPILLVNQLES